MRNQVLLMAVVALAAVPAASKPAKTGSAEPGQLILFEDTGYAGDYFIIDEPRLKVSTTWNIRSIAVHDGEKWQICAKPRFADPCITLDRSLPDASVVGIKGQIGSARLAGN